MLEKIEKENIFGHFLDDMLEAKDIGHFYDHDRGIHTIAFDSINDFSQYIEDRKQSNPELFMLEYYSPTTFPEKPNGVYWN